ncbi:MAG: hypothetical protein PHE29_06900 [Tissierellia bacterium]|nr:hypothetical protein [Tissierellia bacterium]
MGTSQSVNPSVKDNPNWGDLSRSLSYACKSERISEAQLSGIMKNFTKAVGGSRAGRGRSSTFGRAGISRAKKFMNFLSSVQSNGFSDTLNNIGIWDLSELSVNDFINHILTYCNQGSSSLDETAANSAINDLLGHILNNVNEIGEVEEIFNNADLETQHEWLCYFFASYIMEFSDELFGTRILEKSGDRVKIFDEIREYVLRSLEDLNGSERLQNIDWLGEQGDAIIKELQSEILEIWSPE